MRQGLHRSALEGPAVGTPYFETCVKERPDFGWARYYLAKCLRLTGERARAETELQVLLDQTEGSESLMRAHALGLQSVLRFDAFDIAGSRQLILECQPLFQKNQAMVDYAKTVGQLGYLDYAEGQYPSAIERLKKCLDLVREVGDPLTEANVLNNLGMVHSSADDEQSAVSYFDAALVIFKKVGSKPGTALMTGNMGAISLDSGYIEKARAYLNEGLDLYRSLGDQHGLCRLLLNMTILKATDQDLVSAISFGQEGMLLAREIEVDYMEGQFAFTLIRLLADAKRLDECQSLGSEVAPLIAAMKYDEVTDRFLAARAYGSMRAGDLTRAKSYLEQASPSFRENHFVALYTKALMSLEEGDKVRALDFMDQTIEAARTGWKDVFGQIRNAIERDEALPTVSVVTYN